MSDPQQFEDFMLRYQNMVFGTAMRLLANPTEAEDVAQEVFLKAFERFEDLSQSPTAGGWLKTVATNMSLNHLTRYRARWSFFSELVKGGDPEDGEPIEFAAPDTFEHDLEQADRHQVVDKALQKLPPAQRVPLVLFHLHGMTYEQIAAKLNVTLGKVKTDIFRAREAMRRRLRTQLDEIRPA